MQVLGVPVISVSRETAEWGIFHPFSQATTGQEKVCNVDQTVRHARIPAEFKPVTFCIYFKVLNIPLHSVM